MLRKVLLLALLLVSMALMATLTSADQHLAGPCADNLLINAGFENDYRTCPDPYTPGAGPQDQLKLPEGWHPWYDNVPVCPPGDPNCNLEWYNRRPEYKKWDENEHPEPGPLRVRSRPASQMFFNTTATHTAGFYQQASVPAQSWVTFSIWVQVWSNRIDDPWESTLPGDYVVSVGIDPTGGADWSSEDIVWSNPVLHYDEFVQLSVTTQAISDTVTVFTRGAPIWAVKHNDSYWDDACLVVSGTPTPSPTCTMTPSPTPTRTPTPDGIPVPTCETWGTYWEDTFDDPDLPGWELNLAEGSAAISASTLHLESTSGYSNRFPLLWRNDVFPSIDELDLRLRFRHTGLTAYGTSIDIGTIPYDGRRYWHSDPSPSGIRDILYIHHSESEFFVRPLGRRDLAWVGSASDEEWHVVQLKLMDSTFTLTVDGTEIASVVSSLRPACLYIGNPMVVEHWGTWSALAVDDMSVSHCATWRRPWIQFPLVFKGWVAPYSTPTPTLTPEPTAPSPEPTIPTPESTIPGPTPTSEGGASTRNH
ncbi:MAG: hypothetical protein ABIK79_04980 [Chloroflexota bacterium]